MTLPAEVNWWQKQRWEGIALAKRFGSHVEIGNLKNELESFKGKLADIGEEMVGLIGLIIDFSVLLATWKTQQTVRIRQKNTC